VIIQILPLLRFVPVPKIFFNEPNERLRQRKIGLGLNAVYRVRTLGTAPKTSNTRNHPSLSADGKENDRSTIFVRHLLLP
jgi:hypothetical protein